MQRGNTLSIPQGAGRMLVEDAAVLSCPLLGTDQFLRFCKDRDLHIDRERLIRLERLTLFSPVFRVRTPDADNADPFFIPVQPGNNWFAKGWAIDTTNAGANYVVPSATDRSQEGYYSIFQLRDLDMVVRALSLNVSLDFYLECGDQPDWERHLECASEIAQSLRLSQHLAAVGLLCQFISNTYFARTQGDQRTITLAEHFSSCDPWIDVCGFNFDWDEHRRTWDPVHVATYFDLTPEKLRHAYEGLALAQAFSDPLDNWYALVQFIALHERKRLKGTALRAETLREGAHMLRWFYEDLYGERLPIPNEVGRTVIVPMPELSAREDVRRHLELVANRFGVNPQPKVSLFVEGESEELLIARLFNEGYGIPHGKAGIEIVNIHGIGNATGEKKADRFRAILRLFDYLHHHQTICYLILDNENGAQRLKNESMTAASVHGVRRNAVSPERIHVWDISLEFDNLNDVELADVLSRTSERRVMFTLEMIAACRGGKYPGRSLANLYQEHTGHDLPKTELAQEIANKLLGAGRDAVNANPLLARLHEILTMAAQNPLPTMEESWRTNQHSTIFR